MSVVFLCVAEFCNFELVDRKPLVLDNDQSTRWKIT